MSGFAFSHQFSQRWLTTPTAVKQTIVQELDDIVTLLQPTTDLDNFSFRVDNLNDAVESLMQVERVRLQAEREEQERLARERLEQERIENERLEKERLENERLERERLEQERLEQERLEQERLAQEQLEQQRLAEQEAERLEQERLAAESLEKARLEQDRIEIEKLENEYKIAKKSSKKKTLQTEDSTPIVMDETAQPITNDDNPTDTVVVTAPINEAADEVVGSENSVTIERHKTDLVYAISDANDAPVETQSNEAVVETLVKTPIDTTNETTTAPNLDAIKQQIISELQVHIEKYLQESMRLMQDDLHKWLDEEVTRQLDQHISQASKSRQLSQDSNVS